jgi:outer membrane immunogenic protein
MKHLVVSAFSAVVIGLVGSAFAADMPVKAVAPTPPVATWTGLYVGVNGGYGVGSGSLNQSFDFSSTALGANNLLNSSGRGALTGGLFGGQIGYNWQLSSPWLVGLEADWQWASQRNTTTNCTPPATLAFFGAGASGFGYCVATEQKITNFGTARARGGAIVNESLWYVTGGAAWGTVKDTYVASGSANPVIFPGALQPGPFLASGGTFSHTRTGWALGGGVETKVFRGWTAKLEYLHVDLGGRTETIAVPLNAAFGAALNTGGSASVTTRTKVTDDVIRLGLNYKIFWSNIIFEMKPRSANASGLDGDSDLEDDGLAEDDGLSEPDDEDDDRNQFWSGESDDFNLI